MRDGAGEASAGTLEVLVDRILWRWPFRGRDSRRRTVLTAGGRVFDRPNGHIEFVETLLIGHPNHHGAKYYRKI
jgi:hypothetical protein